MAGYVPDSTKNMFGPLTIKHLPTPRYITVTCSSYCFSDMLIACVQEIRISRDSYASVENTHPWETHYHCDTGL